MGGNNVDNMKPEFFQIERGCYKIGINPFMCGLTKKPVVRIECVEDNSMTQDDDGEWIDETDCAMFTFRTIIWLTKWRKK